MRYLPVLVGLSLLAALPAQANPPDRGYVGAIVYDNGQEPLRFACDSLELVKVIYDAGKDDAFRLYPKYRELAATAGTDGAPHCTVAKYRSIRVLEPPVLLGPTRNPIGEVELFFWAVHVDNKPKGSEADYWILYLDAKADRAWLHAGTEI